MSPYGWKSSSWSSPQRRRRSERVCRFRVRRNDTWPRGKFPRLSIVEAGLALFLLHYPVGMPLLPRTAQSC